MQKQKTQSEFKKEEEALRKTILQSKNNQKYREVKEVLKGRPRKKISNHTYLESHAYTDDLKPNEIGYKLWNTYVAIFKPNVIILNSGGYYTMTTNNRINSALNSVGISERVYSHRGTWYYGDGDWHNDKPFYDGLKVSYSGDILPQNNELENDDVITYIE